MSSGLIVPLCMIVFSSSRLVCAFLRLSFGTASFQRSYFSSILALPLGLGVDLVRLGQWR
jgi:hypothetical protein